MAQTRPSRIPQPSTKLGPENVGSHQIKSHQHAVANTRKAQAKEKPSEKSHEGTSSHDVIPSTKPDIPHSDAAGPELGFTSDTPFLNPKKCPIVISDNDDSDDLSSTPAEQPNSSRPKKKKKGKKCSSTGNNEPLAVEVQTISDDDSDSGDAEKLNKTRPTADLDHFFKRAP